MKNKKEVMLRGACKDNLSDMMFTVWCEACYVKLMDYELSEESGLCEARDAKLLRIEVCLT